MIASERFHGLPSIGSSGIIYEIEAFFIRGGDLESLPYYILEQALFYFATEGNVDHAVHIGGLLYGAWYVVPSKLAIWELIL